MSTGMQLMLLRGAGAERKRWEMRMAGLGTGVYIIFIILGACSISDKSSQQADVSQDIEGVSGATGTGKSGADMLDSTSVFQTSSGGFVALSDASSATDSESSSNSSGFDGDACNDSSQRLESDIDAGDAAGKDSNLNTRDAASEDGSLNDAGDSASEDIEKGFCCPDGDCLCHRPDPIELTSDDGPYNVDDFFTSNHFVYYPTDAEPPFAVVAVSNGMTGVVAPITGWARFFATFGMVGLVVRVSDVDQTSTRTSTLLAAIEEIKNESENSDSPLFGKLTDRYGVIGFQMGGNASIIVSSDDPSLKTLIGLAIGPQSGTALIAASRVSIPSLLLCGTSDTAAPCSVTEDIYNRLSNSVPKMMISIPEATHQSWMGPTIAGGGLSGQYSLAFQKVFLEGDERWKALLIEQPGNVSDWRTNIQ